VELNPLPIPSMLWSLFSAGVIDQDPTHRFRRGSKEMPS
jgi:hypothetical protein